MFAPRTWDLDHYYYVAKIYRESVCVREHVKVKILKINMISCRIFMCHLYVILIVLMKEYNVQDIAISLSNRNVAWQYMSTQPITLKPQSLKAPSSVKTSSSHRDSPRPTYFTACFCFWIFFPQSKSDRINFRNTLPMWKTSSPSSKGDVYFGPGGSLLM